MCTRCGEPMAGGQEPLICERCTCEGSVSTSTEEESSLPKVEKSLQELIKEKKAEISYLEKKQVNLMMLSALKQSDNPDSETAKNCEKLADQAHEFLVLANDELLELVKRQRAPNLSISTAESPPPPQNRPDQGTPRQMKKAGVPAKKAGAKKQV